MRSKRVLTLLLAICLIASMLVAPVTAATVEEPVQNSSSASNSKENSLLINGTSAGGKLNTLRDKLAAEQKLQQNGQWVVTPSDKTPSVSLMDAELPKTLEQLKAAAEQYAAGDVVSAFIVLDDEPMVNFFSSINDVPDAQTAQMEMKQDAIITMIEEDVLGGEELEVTTQFSYLTNSIVIETEFENLPQIAALPGVKTVFLTPVFYPCEVDTTLDPQTINSGVMTDVDDVWNLNGSGYTGKGMTIAILDTGLDVDHPSFAADPEGASWTAADLEAWLAEYDLNAEALYSAVTGETLTADDLYYSAKVPFTFHYVTGKTDVRHNDSLSDHGTHVAGIAAANPVEGSGVVGMAPDAQIIVMKVFDPETGGSDMRDLILALEDAMTLGVDVINMSLGSPAGFSQSGKEAIDEIFENIAKTGTVVDVAAGNDGTASYGSLYGNYMSTTSNIDNATVSSPSTYAGSMSIASVENTVIKSPYFSLADGTKVFHQPSAEYLYGYTTLGLEALAGQELEYVIVPNLGEAEDFYDADGNSIVDGKVAVVNRGEINFSTKAANAEAAGAVACLIWNNVSENIYNFGMTTSVTDDEGNIISMPGIPVALITLEDGQTMADAGTKTMTTTAELGDRAGADTVQMSSFSCWGVAPDLRLLPDLTGVGGNVYSCYDGGGYGLMSGTSMATPQVAGVTALVMQYLKEQFPNATGAELQSLVNSLLMSTAVPVTDANTGLEASPRQQGAGLVNALNAVTAEAYLSVEGSERPKAELFDSENGTYSFTFTVHNFGDEAKTYTLSSSLLCEDYAEDSNYPGVYFMAEQEHELDNSAVSFSGNTVTVAAGETASVTVTIDLTAADKEWINTYFPSGNYVEGFVYLTDENGVDLSLPFLGFYGSWDKAPLFDTGYWYETGFWDGVSLDADMYYHVLWTDLGGQDWVLGFNPFTGPMADGNGEVIYNSYNNVLSPNGDGVLDNIPEIYLSLLRNAGYMDIVYTDAEGNELYHAELEKDAKTMYNSYYGQNIPFFLSSYTDYTDLEVYNFTDAAGNYLENGTVLTLTISGQIDYEGARTDFVEQIPVYIDTAAPVITAADESTDENGNYLTLTIQDDHPAYVALLNTSGTQVYAEYSDLDLTDNGDGTYSLKMDVTDLGDELMVAVYDYGANEAYYTVTYTLTENYPEVSEDTLYAYRIRDLYTAYYYGEDYMYSWGALDKTTGEFTPHLYDVYEYYALTAAEYAGGYVFAVDAAYNFIYMVPGLWNRNVICNLGIHVVDMAFDDTTGTMYLATKTAGEYYDTCGLYSVDLLTGELTQLNYGYGSNTPWSMTCVNGKMYAVKSKDSKLYEVNLGEPYQVDVEYSWGTYPMTIDTYDMVEVKDAEGNAVTLTTSTGNAVSPAYYQSMTYSEKDGKIYYAYYGSDGNTYELLTIDPATWTCSAVPFSWDQEYVGLLTAEGSYTLPESEAVTLLQLDKHDLTLGTGAYASLTATLLPWNAPVTEEVVWTSSDESVAMVYDGVVLTVGEGIATITASYGESGEVYDECVVKVVNVKGQFNAFNYYTTDDTYNNWFTYDMAEKTMTNFVDYCPITFYAADYNGHDGYIYGFDEGGQFYKYDPDTNEGEALGAPVAKDQIPADMAYDYSTGLLYGIVYDYNSWTTTLYAISMTTGKMVEVATAYDVYGTLACDMEGNLYAINVYGELYKLYLIEGGYGGDIGVMPLSADDSTSMMIQGELLLEGLGNLNYIQSMCYDANNDVLLWAAGDSATIMWIDGLDTDTPYVVDLGNPTGYYFNYFGMHVIPDEIPELAYTPVESMEAEDMMLLVNGSALPSVTVNPLNATNQNVTYVSSDESVAAIENGMVVGVGVGTATITATLEDNGTTYTCTFKVSVKDSTGSIYSFMMTDLANYQQMFWMQFEDTDPQNYMPINYIMDSDGIYYLLYSAEYVNGYVYAYGYDMDDYSASFQFLTIDPESWSVVAKQDMGSDFPFVYDLSFDYTTGTMYALAGPSDTTSDLYYVDMQSGKLVLCMVTDPMFMSIAVDANGTLYAMSNSEMVYDEDGFVVDSTNAMLYTVDVANGTYEVVLDTGVKSNKLAPMTYSYDTGYLYWNALYQADYWSPYEVGFYLIDMADPGCYKLGNIGTAGSQITSMVIISEEYPEIPDSLQNVLLTTEQIELSVGDTQTLEYLLQPYTMTEEDVEITWTSSDESVATVDENGEVTGVSAGVATITLTVTDGENTFTVECKVIVYGEDDYFITYNWTKMGFAKISRTDPTQITMLTEGEEIGVDAMEMVNGILYGYDANGDLFKTSVADGFVREYIGNANVQLRGENTETVEYYLDIRDMAWDPVNGRMLVLACEMYYDSEYDWSNANGGCIIYTADLATGALTELTIVAATDYDSGDYRVVMLTVADDGQAYMLSYFMSYVCELNLETGEYTNLTTFQNQGVSASDYGDLMAMTYDDVTNAIYMAFTQNGNYYCLYKYDVATTAITLVGNMGEVEAGYWTSYGDSFAGLVLNEEHVHNYGISGSNATCTEDGVHIYTCEECGDTYTETEEATGHAWNAVSHEATCTEDAYVEYTCENCGETKTVVEEGTAHGHSYKSVVTEPTATEKGYTTHTCEHCGHSYVDSYTSALGNGDGPAPSGDSFGALWIVLLLVSMTGAAALVLGRKKWFEK